MKLRIAFGFLAGIAILSFLVPAVSSKPLVSKAPLACSFSYTSKFCCYSSPNLEYRCTSGATHLSCSAAGSYVCYNPVANCPLVQVIDCPGGGG